MFNRNETRYSHADCGADPEDKARRDPKQMFSRPDTSGDGKIEPSEFLRKNSKNKERRTAFFKKLFQTFEETCSRIVPWRISCAWECFSTRG